jgi:hypothetical protein
MRFEWIRKRETASILQEISDSDQGAGKNGRGDSTALQALSASECGGLTTEYKCSAYFTTCYDLSSSRSLASKKRDE